ncbi:hypothetical protein ACFO4O_05670 [Glaciecola siphonariae]|uniref:Zinc ribbon domain-containing protein n=1 Tax=Glaciecola siphonariae TaxID=521012 RepID=A0ABV9LUM1_9ALTE
MAITNCPACSKPISDKAQVCPHCSLNMGGASPEDIQRKLSMERFQKLHRIQNQSMMAILIFIVGIYFVFMGDFPDTEKGVLMYNIAVGVAALGFIWYAVNRVRITLAKRS